MILHRHIYVSISVALDVMDAGYDGPAAIYHLHPSTSVINDLDPLSLIGRLWQASVCPWNATLYSLLLILWSCEVEAQIISFFKKSKKKQNSHGKEKPSEKKKNRA